MGEHRRFFLRILRVRTSHFLRLVQNESSVSLVRLALQATEFIQKARILWLQIKDKELWYKKADRDPCPLLYLLS